MTIFCDICERAATVKSEVTAQRAGWFIAEDEPDAVDRHGICPKCAKDMDK